MKTKYLSLALASILLSSCAIITDEYQVNQRKVIAYLLEDLPLPNDADIIKVPSGEITNYELCLLIAFFVTLWPIIPSGSFFNNWLNILYFFPLGFYLENKLKVLKK